MENQTKVHLICNAHLDPIWQWTWDEGITAALSTFRSAAELCEEYDYVFCHGEVLLYEAIEEYAPELFEKIKELVKKGKWHIIGGWYLQPDCNLPCGESFVRQIRVGQKYFGEKFGVQPTTAIGFDAFGHSRGLVQIIKKSGQDSYIAMRPFPWQMPLDSNVFWWEGFDGSKIKGFRSPSTYATGLGIAAQRITERYPLMKENVRAVLWGVGNHGGGPSRKDLQDIANLKIDGVTFEHSTPERFFAETEPEITVAKSLRPSMPGCYVSMSRLKHKYVEVENLLYDTEIICALAELNGGKGVPEEIREAEKALLMVQFHDTLPGSCVKSGEENGIRKLYYAQDLLSRSKLRAFISLSNDFKAAKEGEYPIFVYNPHPYEYATEVECEFSLAHQLLNGDSIIRLYKDGKEIPCQQITEESVIKSDFRKKIVFNAVLPPLSVSRYDVVTEHFEEGQFRFKAYKVKKDLVFENCGRKVVISAKTGNMISYSVNGKEYLTGEAFAPYLYEDNADPWGMSGKQLKQLGEDKPKKIKLDKKPDGVFRGLSSIEVIEDGDVYTAVECFYKHGDIRIRKEYKIYRKKIDVDVSFDVFYNDSNSLLKVHIPTVGGEKYVGQTAYGVEDQAMDGSECPTQRYVGVINEEECIGVFNDGIYGNSYKEGEIRLSLLRGAMYCAHPTLGRPLARENCYSKKLDQGEHNYSFKFTVCNCDELERKAEEFNRKVFALNLFPRGTGKKEYCNVELDNSEIVMTAMSKTQDDKAYYIRLFNGSALKKRCKLRAADKTIELLFDPNEIKTVVFDEEAIRETENLLV